jgi:hypothetical protein
LFSLDDVFGVKPSKIGAMDAMAFFVSSPPEAEPGPEPAELSSSGDMGARVLERFGLSMSIGLDMVSRGWEGVILCNVGSL